ncbi:MAG: SHOCT domain-containing protein [Kofleriaceae bacterium]|nr:SHOCT domain-containing protein [Kofleriaceae bacterium]
MRRRRARTGLVGTAARTAVIAKTAQKVGGGTAMRQQAAAEEAAHKRAAKKSATGLLTDEVVDQLKKLGELRDAGVLTEDEFAAKKAKLLP